ncbi:Protein trichome birefringence-like 6, partial [Ananas comosus]
MERQRIFSLKPMKLLALSFTVSSSLLFCFLFSLWVFDVTPSGPAEAHLQFFGSFKSAKEGAFAASRSDFSGNATKGPALWETHVAGEAVDSTVEVKDAILARARVRGGSDLSKNEVDDAVDSEKDGIFNGAHLERAHVSSQEATVTNTSKSTSSEAGELISRGSPYGASGESTNPLAEKIESNSTKQCDIYDGKWVYDDESYPLYRSKSCPFIDEGFNCEANGRVDLGFMKWRWQPHHCSIPRFNPVKMLEMIRGKRLVFVGDSINRNQWESMMCLLWGTVSDPRRVHEARGRRITKEKGNYNFKFLDYNCSVEYYVTHFLVHESKARIGLRRVKTLRIDAMDRSSSRWRGADILVFNTAHWWSHHKTKAGVNYYQEGDRVHPRLDVSTAFRKALTTWASWVDQHVNPRKTQVFFRSSSPSHFSWENNNKNNWPLLNNFVCRCSGGEWNSGGHCRESTRPLNETSERQVPLRNLVLDQVIKQMRTSVTVLNITNLSGLRIDGHPSIYGKKFEKVPQSSIQDCSHWCLPGVPDTWNELLYFHLISHHKPILAS